MRFKRPAEDWATRSAIDAVAALLSEWVYEAEPQTDEQAAAPAPLTLNLGDKPVPLLVHRVFQDTTGEVGTAAKVATVTAEVPGVQGPVLYLVFKGTSTLLDMLKWDFQRDYEHVASRAPPEARGCKPVDFIHRGAAHTVRQLNLFQREVLLKRLEAAASKGVQRLVLTGHSLGGMYAQAFLHWVMTEPLESIQRGAAQLLFGARAVTFGAPMVFGTNAETPSAGYFLEFEKDFRSRATNFAHEKDPCPRAWSALDLKELLQGTARSKVRATLGRRVADSIIGDKAEAFVSSFVESDDFTKLTTVAKQYKHVARIVQLSRTTEPHFHWKDGFKSAEGNIADHDMGKYRAALVEGLDPNRDVSLFFHDDERGSKQREY